MQLCKLRTSCKQCDLAYLLKDYVKPLIQLLTNDLQEYSMRLQTTKCLNTGVLIMLFMAGKKGLNTTMYCDNETVIDRHINGQDTNLAVIRRMAKTILSQRFSNRQLYYVLISDGYFFRGQEKVYFPGHVFIIEKFTGNNQPLFYLYQSYINEYDLQGHYKNNNDSLLISNEKVKQMISNLSYILTKGVWDVQCTKYWYDITKVNASQFEGCETRDKVFICFRGIQVKKCADNIVHYVKSKLKSIPNGDDVYGNSSKYDVAGYSKNDIKSLLHNLLADIKNYVK